MFFVLSLKIFFKIVIVSHTLSENVLFYKGKCKQKYFFPVSLRYSCMIIKKIIYLQPKKNPNADFDFYEIKKWSRGRVARQWIANPSTAVRIRPRPPTKAHSINFEWAFCFLRKRKKGFSSFELKPFFRKEYTELYIALILSKSS